MKKLIAFGVGLWLVTIVGQVQSEETGPVNPMADQEQQSQTRTGGYHYQGRIRIEKDRNEEGYLLRIYTGGDLDPESVQVVIQGNSILVENDRSFQREEQSEWGAYRYSRNTSHFRRRLTIPRDADTANMQRRVEDGVLIITLPYLRPTR